MKKIEQQLEKDSSEVHLLRSEHTAIKASILGEAKRQAPIPSPFFSFSWVSAYRLVPATLAVLLVMSVPAAYASQESVPGDFLYSFEINVVEEVQAFLSVSDQERAQFHTDRLEERLHELQTVINDPNTNNLLEPVIKEVEEHATKAVAAINNNPDQIDKIEQLIMASALVEANTALIDMAQNQTSPDEAIENIQQFTSDALTDEVTSYADKSNESEISQSITEDVATINELSEDSDSVTEAYVDNQLHEASEDMNEENWADTLNTLAETQVELIKQNFLDETQ